VLARPEAAPVAAPAALPAAPVAAPVVDPRIAQLEGALGALADAELAQLPEAARAAVAKNYADPAARALFLATLKSGGLTTPAPLAQPATTLAPAGPAASPPADPDVDAVRTLERLERTSPMLAAQHRLTHGTAIAAGLRKLAPASN
jgi:dihydroneopterin aldolase/2-amino-4-hydroxy-6-hydroxymethyldihydropteridine diphosphokinase